VDYLKGKYSLNTEISTEDIDDDLTAKVARAGWFIGFTSNLTNKKKE